MGQYWYPVNLDKREFLHPHKLGAGLKLWEQLAAHPGTGAALVILCAAQPVPRGGGDLKDTPGVVGRWAGDRIAFVGDYAERGDLAPEHDADLIYWLCGLARPEDLRPSSSAGTWEAERDKLIEEWREIAGRQGQHPETIAKYEERIARVQAMKTGYTDISTLVRPLIERHLGGRYVGMHDPKVLEGWLRWKDDEQEVRPW